MASKRSLRPDPNFDLLIQTLYPNREEYEAHQIKALEKLNNSQSQAALVHSISEGIKVQNQTRFQRLKKSQNEGDTSASGLNTSDSVMLDQQSEPQPSTSGNKNNHYESSSASVRLKKNKNPEDRKFELDNGERMNIDSYGDSAEDLELIFKPHPSENDWSFTKFFTDDLKRYLKTSAGATGNFVNIFVFQYTLYHFFRL